MYEHDIEVFFEPFGLEGEAVLDYLERAFCDTKNICVNPGIRAGKPYIFATVESNYVRPDEAIKAVLQKVRSVGLAYASYEHIQRLALA